MDMEMLFALAKPFLEKNNFGIAHTRRVFNIARTNKDIEKCYRKVLVGAKY